MRVALSNDKAGYRLKEAAATLLREQGHEVLDFGTKEEAEAKAHTQAGRLVAEAIQRGEADRGILFCGTGMGVCLTANKFKGVYAGVVESVFAAQHCRLINNCNVMCAGGYILGEYMAKEMVDAFINTEFAHEFEKTRKVYLQSQCEQIAAIETENFKDTLAG